MAQQGSPIVPSREAQQDQQDTQPHSVVAAVPDQGSKMNPEVTQTETHEVPDEETTQVTPQSPSQEAALEQPVARDPANLCPVCRVSLRIHLFVHSFIIHLFIID